MRVHIVLAHPEPTSFNAALARRAQDALKAASASVSLSDLHAQDFDPVEHGRHYSDRADPTRFVPLAEQRHASATHTLPIAVEREMRALEAADLVILQFPLWWHGAPAMLKGWFDRVFPNGAAYTSRLRYEQGHFRGRRAVLSVTSGAPEAAFGPGSRAGDPDVMLWPLHYSLHYLGFAVLRPQWSFGVQGHGYAYEAEEDFARRRSGMLDMWERRLNAIAAETPLTFPGWADWDADGRRMPQGMDGA